MPQGIAYFFDDIFISGSLQVRDMWLPKNSIPLNTAFHSVGTRLIPEWSENITDPIIWKVNDFEEAMNYTCEQMTVALDASFGDAWGVAALDYIKKEDKIVHFAFTLGAEVEELSEVVERDIAWGFLASREVVKDMYLIAKDKAWDVELNFLDPECKEIDGDTILASMFQVDLGNGPEPIELTYESFKSYEDHTQEYFSPIYEDRLAAQEHFTQVSDWFRGEMFDGAIKCYWLSSEGEKVYVPESHWAKEECVENFKTMTFEESDLILEKDSFECVLANSPLRSGVSDIILSKKGNRGRKPKARDRALQEITIISSERHISENENLEALTEEINTNISKTGHTPISKRTVQRAYKIFMEKRQKLN